MAIAQNMFAELEKVPTNMGEALVNLALGESALEQGDPEQAQKYLQVSLGSVGRINALPMKV